MKIDDELLEQFKRPILDVDVETGKIRADRLDEIDDRFGVVEK